MRREIQPAPEVEKAVQARFPHYRLDHASYEKKGLPATWHCALHDLDFRANASTLLRPNTVGCPACVEERALKKRKRLRADPELERNVALIAEHLSEEHARIYRMRCEGAKLKDIGAKYGISEQMVSGRLVRVAGVLFKVGKGLS